MTWTPRDAWQEVARADLPPVLRIRCELLLLRMRIERLSRALPATSVVDPSGHGRTALRLWALVPLVEQEKRDEVRDRVQQVQRVYGLSSEYLHSRRSGLVPPPVELATWLAGVKALEELIG